MKRKYQFDFTRLNIDKMKLLTHTTLTFLIFFLIISTGNSQKKLSLFAGAGIPELYHIGARYQIKQSQFGFSTGWDNESTRSYSGDLFFHYGKISSFSSRKVWYNRWNFTYWREKNEYEIIKTYTLSSRIGREFNLSSSFGIGLDAGLVFRLSESTTIIKPRPSGWDLDLDFGVFELVLPSIGIHAFYKL